MKRKINYVYLLSSPHSGSTLMACTLGCHKKILTVGEFGYPFEAHGMCSCGTTYEKCKFWKRALCDFEKKFGEKLQVGRFGFHIGHKKNASFLFDLYYHFFPLKILDRTRDLCFSSFSNLPDLTWTAVERSVRLADILLSQNGADIFFDTTKNPFQVKFLAQHPRIDLKVIVLVRDGRAVTWSLINKEKWSLEKSVGTWLWSNRNIDRLCKNYLNKDKIFYLKLEELCHNPQHKIKELLRFIGVEPNLEIKGIKESGLHIIGNSMRLKFDGHIREPDKSWKQNLSTMEIDYFEKKAGQLNKKFGYK